MQSTESVITPDQSMIGRKTSSTDSFLNNTENSEKKHVETSVTTSLQFSNHSLGFEKTDEREDSTRLPITDEPYNKKNRGKEKTNVKTKVKTNVKTNVKTSVKTNNDSKSPTILTAVESMPLNLDLPMECKIDKLHECTYSITENNHLEVVEKVEENYEEDLNNVDECTSLIPKKIDSNKAYKSYESFRSFRTADSVFQCHEIPQEPIENAEDNRKKGIEWIFICLGLKVVATSASLGVLPFLVTENLGKSSLEVGLSYSVFAFSQLLSCLLFGRLSDAFGRRKIILVSFLCTFLGSLILILSVYRFESIFGFYFSRFVTGLSGGSISMVAAMVADVTQVYDTFPKDSLETTSKLNYENTYMEKDPKHPNIVCTKTSNQIQVETTENDEKLLPNREVYNIKPSSTLNGEDCSHKTKCSTNPDLVKNDFSIKSDSKNTLYNEEYLSNKRTKYNGFLGAIIASGFVVGPALGGLVLYLSQNRRLYCLLFTVCCITITFILAIIFLPETLPPIRRRPLAIFNRFKTSKDMHYSKDTSPNSASFNCLEKSELSQIIGISYLPLAMICFSRFFLSLSNSVMNASYYLLLTDVFSFKQPDREISKILVVTGLCIVLYQGFIFRRVVDRLGPHLTLVLGAVLQSFGIYGAFFTANNCSLATHVLFYCFSYSIAYAIVEPNVPYVTSLYADKSHQGFAHGAVTSCRFLASVVGPSLYGKLFINYRPQCFMIGSISALLPVFFMICTRLSSQKIEHFSKNNSSKISEV